ncbi:MAG: SDR family oxidoreductase [Clostridia bacterium]|nr:SDR family oxidoreductase [Clostridia bacterium]
MSRRVIWITGGSSGIGKAAVRKFAGTGDRVAFTFLHSEAAARALESETGAFAIRADVSDSAQVNRARDAILSRFGRIDALVCAAGVAGKGLVMDQTDEAYDRIMNTNLFGTFAAIRAVLPCMIERRGGSIVTVSSMWGETGGACEALYSASKAGIIGLTRAVAKEVGSAGIRVNCISPGVIDTPMNADLSPEDVDSLVEETPLGRIGMAEEVAEAICFLAGEGAGFITGQVLPVNGGIVIG